MNKTVLIADDDLDLAELLARRCESLGLTADIAANAMSALGKAEETLPDLVILDVNMPYGNGLGVCEMMADHHELAKIPVIVMTGAVCEDTVRRCHQLCAYYVPKGPELWSRIEPLIGELLHAEGDNDPTEESPAPGTGALLPPIVVGTPRGEQPEEASKVNLIDAAFEMLSPGRESDGIPQTESTEDPRPWILSIEDDEDVFWSISCRMEELGLDVRRAVAGRDGYRRAFFDTPSLILLDYELPDGNGDYVLRRLKESPATASIPVIVLTGRREPTIEHQMRRLGADEFLNKPYEWEQLREAVLSLAPTCQPARL
ncbi:Transcriptional regulatory protein CusR [Posidoniimonas polymericola]|uniref:Transcriptional regulatory protein CusR n=1 Tax=Posidoniimonas polymericola TaxID=2528002 RepID=A0A5C5YH54_9BACT|nr:response regulator [Posidoniimonas polymericola]TWT74518.1 Transcriptional regulatory protein CusR [Posidoniimonas polymericola]